MAVSAALEKSARDFCLKYACSFDFATFESRVEEFTFLRPVGGWIDVYKATFDRLYKHTLEKVAAGTVDAHLDAEAMLDDFEYTLIRPYVNEGDKEIKHKPYVGMDRISRLEYLLRLTEDAPSNRFELYAEKYKSGELSLEPMRDKPELGKAGWERCVEIASYVQAVESVNQGRSSLWRALHPFKNNAEKRDPARMKKAFIEEIPGGEECYREAVAAARETFDGYQKVNATLEDHMIRAKEEMDRKQKLNDAMRESIRIEGFERESLRELSPRVERYTIPLRENQIKENL